MNWLRRTLSSSIGGKYIVALTGIAMVGFLVAHLSGNLLVFGGAALLGLEGSTGRLALVGVICILGACAGWAIDNNLTQTLTVRDPFAIVTVKTGVAAAVTPWRAARLA